MLDLNDLQVFERVAALHGFPEAARALGLPKSNVSRSVARLEAALSIRITTSAYADCPRRRLTRRRRIQIIDAVHPHHCPHNVHSLVCRTTRAVGS